MNFCAIGINIARIIHTHRAPFIIFNKPPNTLSKALAQEIGSSKITVNCIAAGAVNTDMNKCHSNETLAEIKEKTPLGRIGEPQEVADIAVFLASEKANFITGQVIEVSGGFR